MTAGIIPFQGPRELATIAARLPILFLLEPKILHRFWEFFTANIRNRNTRRAYNKAAWRFAEYCEGRGLHDLAWVETRRRSTSARQPTR
jgi:hypothetical protein